MNEKNHNHIASSHHITSHHRLQSKHLPIKKEQSLIFCHCSLLALLIIATITELPFRATHHNSMPEKREERREERRKNEKKRERGQKRSENKPPLATTAVSSFKRRKGEERRGMRSHTILTLAIFLSCEHL